MKVNYISPYLKGEQGKVPSYMAFFFKRIFNHHDVFINLEYNTNYVNFIYPIEFKPVRSPIGVVFYGPDSILLLFRRAIFSKNQFTYIRILSLIRFIQYQYIYSRLNKQTKIITVGMKDLFDFQSRGFKNVYFLPHPVEINQNERKRGGKKNKKISLGISGSLGRFNCFYCGKWYDYLIEILRKNNYSSFYRFCFLGKQYASIAKEIEKLGYEVDYKEWIQDYNNFLSEVDLYICLLAVGAGTKNRVLSANAAGIKVIGTEVALENIDCNENYLIYTVDDLNKILFSFCGKGINFLSDEAYNKFVSYHSEKNVEQIAKNIIFQ